MQKVLLAMRPRALVLQHFTADAPWYLEHALSALQVEVDLLRVDEGATVPDSLDGHDALVVLGGPASAAQGAGGYPSLNAEMGLFVEAHDMDKPALGICLGAQVLARAAGANVYAGLAGKEIGWTTVHLANGASTQEPLAGIGPNLVALQWHGDTFDLPIGARLLLTSDVYPNQAFQWGSCLGLQPHFEVDSIDGAQAFVEAFPDEAELAIGGASGILGATPQAIRDSDASRCVILSGWARSIVSSTARN